MNELHIDPRMPPVDEVVLRPLLEKRAEALGDKTYVWFDSGLEWSYKAMRREAVRTANALRALGIKRGDHVICWLPTGPDILRIWFGLNYLGAVYVPINLAYKGNLLEHVVNNAGAELMVAHVDLVDRLGAVKCPQLKRVVVFGGAPASVPGLSLLPSSVLQSDDESLPALDAPIAPWEPQSIIYTSGTTGPSKGVLSSYMHLYSMAAPPKYFTGDDRFLINLPMFHAGGTFPTYAMLMRGGSLAMVESFRTDQFWSEIARSGATTLILLGSMAAFVVRQPERKGEREHGLRSALVVPMNEYAFAVRERFGVEVHTHFNMSEISMPLLTEANPSIVGVAGKPRQGVSVRIVDANDCEVPTGTVGELIVRTDCPWALNSGYYKEPQATATAWRNGWFHTGDAFRRDEAGNFFFVDRIKDAIRRRGENISSFEVEACVSAYPGVRDVAAVAYPSPEGEDEVLAIVTMQDGVTLDPAEMIRFLQPRMAHFMIPRYVWVVPELPRTPTQKTQKHLLRAAAREAQLWDREAAGIVIRREKISKLPG
jgi:crotonobetaine/carnitine-CoA ligase